MCVADEVIRNIVNSSQIPSGKRRQEILRELRAHVEDVMLAAREAGHGDDEIQRLVLADFGDPDQIARDFAWVYRHERAILRLSAFLVSTLAVASLLSAGILAMQAAVAIGFGRPLLKVIASRHTVIEALDILFTVATYMGFLSLEKLFDRHRFQKAIALITLAFAVAVAGCAAVNVHAPFLIFGFVNGVFFRSIRQLLKRRMARTVIAVAGFALAGLVLFQLRSSGFQYAVALSWLVMGAGYQLMADLSPRVDAVLFDGLQQNQGTLGS
jgi:hypothetical protein